MPHNIFKNKSYVTKFTHCCFSFISKFISFLVLCHVDISNLLKSKLFELNKYSKCSRQSKNIPDYIETFQTIRKLSRQWNKFQDNLEMFQTVQKLSRQCGNLPDNTETSQTIKQLSGQSGNDPDDSENFQTIRKIFS